MSKKPRREYEAPDMGAMLTRQARALVRRAAEGDLEAMSVLRAAEREMHDALVDAVTENRKGRNAYSWTEIGRELGISRQAAQQQYGRK